MTKLSGMFNGEEHWLEIGQYFPADGATLVIDGWEELEEEDELSPYESPSVQPILRDTGQWSVRQDELFPLRHAEQAWGVLSINLSALAHIMQFEKKQYQHVWPAEGSVKGQVKWSLQSGVHVTERL